jgi:DNA-directed RNA polymerase subunit F
MTIQKALSDMKREELVGMLLSIHEALWDPEVYYKHVEWTPETLDQIAEVFQMEGLHPYNLEEYQDE